MTIWRTLKFFFEEWNFSVRGWQNVEIQTFFTRLVLFPQRMKRLRTFKNSFVCCTIPLEYVKITHIQGKRMTSHVWSSQWNRRSSQRHIYTHHGEPNLLEQPIRDLRGCGIRAYVVLKISQTVNSRTQECMPAVAESAGAACPIPFVPAWLPSLEEA